MNTQQERYSGVLFGKKNSEELELAEMGPHYISEFIKKFELARSKCNEYEISKASIHSGDEDIRNQYVPEVNGVALDEPEFFTKKDIEVMNEFPQLYDEALQHIDDYNQLKNGDIDSNSDDSQLL